MKTTKIDFRTKIVSTFLGLSGLMTLFFSCDVLEPDADVLKPAITMTEDQVFVLSNNSAFIDLNAKVKTNTPVRLSITSAPKFGTLDDLGKGLLQYTPSPGNEKARDEFEFTVLSEKNEIIKVDTIIITIENDSTKFPCGIFPSDDRVYGVQKNIAYDIYVLSNDYICGTDSADIVLSIYRPDTSFPPYFGTAEVTGQKIIYTAGNTFEGQDKLIYKLHPIGEPAKAVYGMVYIAGKQPCDFFLKDDAFYFKADSLYDKVFLNAFQNDSLCQSISNYRINIAQQPKYGKSTVSGHLFTYEVADSVTIQPSFNDDFLYEICMDAKCKTARVDIKTRKDSTACVFSAVADTMDLSGNTIPLIYLDVLKNDKVCEGVSSFTITEPPNYGASYVANKTIAYQRDPLMIRNDSLEYQICNAEKCSRAKVYIKTQ